MLISIVKSLFYAFDLALTLLWKRKKIPDRTPSETFVSGEEIEEYNLFEQVSAI